MSHISSPIASLTCATAVASFLYAPAAFADVTAAEVWADWRGYMEGFGYTVTGEEATSGDTLTVSNIVMALSMPDTEGVFEYRTQSMGFIANSDGTVNVTMDPQSDMTMAMVLETGEAVDIALSYDTENFVMQVSGDPATLKYTHTTDKMTVTLDELVVDGTPITSELARFMMTAADVTGTTDIRVGETRAYNQIMTSGAVEYDVLFVDPETTARVEIKGGSAGMSFGGDGTFPMGVAAQDMAQLLGAGLDFNGTFGFAGGKMDMNFNGPDGPGTATTSSKSGKLAVAMGPDGLSYDVSQEGLNVNMLMPGVPLPLAFEMEESKFNLSMPIQKSDEEQDFAFGFTMGNFTMADMLWGLFDPTAQLPRDPATIAIDLTGKAKLLFDFLDPAQAAELQSTGATPGELNALTLKTLLVDAAGAKLSGTGDFTFDNTDLATFGGVPRPTGAVDLQLAGANGLLDKLVAMGLLPQEQAMGARMMMGLFAVPGEAEDTLSSKIEINDQGHVLANGQRIQ